MDAVELARALEHLFDADQQRDHLERLDDIILRAATKAPDLRGRVRLGGDVDDGDVVFFHMLEQSEAVEPRQHDVEQREVEGMILFQVPRGKQAVVENHVIIARILQMQRERVRNAPVVLDDEDSVRHAVAPDPI